MITELNSNRQEFFPKYTDEEITEWYILFGEIAILCAKVNHFTKYCVFFEYPGHVGWVRISIRRSKERYNENVLDSEFDVSANYPNVFGERVSSLVEMRKKKAILIEILARNDIPYEDLKSELYTYTEELWSF